MDSHQYPEHIVDAVTRILAKRILVTADWDDLDPETRSMLRSDADHALQTIWDLSRIDDPEDVDKLPSEAVILSQGTATDVDDFVEQLDEFSFPARILYWGDPV